MNNQATVSSKFSFKSIIQYVKQSLAVSKQSSADYKKVMFVIFSGVIIFNWAILHILFIDKGYTFRILLRSFSEASFYVLICHYFIRSFLKIKFINNPIKWPLISVFILWLFILATLHFALSIGINKLEFFDKLDVTQVQFMNEDGSIDTAMEPSAFWFMGILQQFFHFLFWSILYLAWQSHLSKKELQKQVQQAQIQQLTNQLSPHFLFNTFNSIRALIYEDQDKAADTVTQLAELFRTHLQAHLRAKSSLEEEWQVTQRYLAIEQTRLEERLKLTVNIDDELRQQQLPTLTLLTLIENAIKHGISPNAETGFIDISAKKITEKHWQLHISNSVNATSKAMSTKTGIINIEKRLNLMFGTSASFTYQLTPADNNINPTFIAILELPYA
jgi:hypothetical protein